MMYLETAPAKVNLSLHVTGQRADGYHLLDSVVVFADVADVLRFRPDDQMSLTLKGAFAGPAGAGPDNLVWRAAVLAGVSGHITLEKNIPVAAGLGGGSADAAAMLRLGARLGQAMPDRPEQLGADVPVCLDAYPQRMSGIGEVLTPLPTFPPLWIVLVNPRVPVPTGKVFTALARKDNLGITAPPKAFETVDALIAWVAAQRNDLEAPAIQVAPKIGAVLDMLRAQNGALLSRMSGSGATCFALFADQDSAQNAAMAIRDAEPEYWVADAPILPGLKGIS